MIILKPYETKFLPFRPKWDWCTPSQAQEKNWLGHENQTRFRIRAKTHDGVVRWVGWFDDRDDVDAFLTAAIDGSIRYQRALWNLPNETWLPQYGWGNVGWRPDFIDLIYDFATVIFKVSGTTFTVPSDSNGVSGGAGEFIDCIGGGGSGAVCRGTTGDCSNGGSGAAFGRITSLVLTPGGVTVQVGVGGASVSTSSSGGIVGNPGTGTWFNGTGLLSCSVSADFGLGGNQSNSGTLASVNGGQAANGTGTTKFNGGAAGGMSFTPLSGAVGGGGAAGPNGAGVASAQLTTDGGTTAGGNGDNGSGGAGSAGSTSSDTSAGGNGTEYDASHGSGGASGGTRRNAAGTNTNSGAGGSYGAGSGASVNVATGLANTVSSGKAGDGLITYSYNAVVGGAKVRGFVFG